jgi:rubrerythrin
MKYVSLLASVGISITLASCTTSNASGDILSQASSATYSTPIASVNFEEVKLQNLKDMQNAYSNEVTTHKKYEAYAKQARKEGYAQIALLFEATAIAENIHAQNHLSVLQEMKASVPVVSPQFTVNSTKENLLEAIGSESFEAASLYPKYMNNAQVIGNELSHVSLNYAFQTEQKHKPLYEKALAALETNSLSSLPKVYYVCPTCGNTYASEAPGRCGVSMTSSEEYIRVN